MKKAADFSYYVSKFLARYLPGEAGASPNTILSYRDTFLLFIKYCKAQENTPPEKITLELLTRERICTFLSWLENERNCSVLNKEPASCGASLLLSLHADGRCNAPQPVPVGDFDSQEKGEIGNRQLHVARRH